MALFQRRTTAETAEMSFVDHLDVLRKHLMRAVLGIVAGGAIVAYYNEFFVKKVLMGPTHSNFVTYDAMCNLGQRLGMGKAFCMPPLALKMQSTTVSGQFSMFFTVIIIGGLIISFPWVFYQFWAFIKPGLNKKELNRTRGVIFWVSLLFFLGISFGYFILAPYSVNFFANFQLDETIVNQWTITSYIDTLVPLILGSGLSFQMPLVIFFLAKVGIVNSGYLRKIRRYAIVVILIVAGVITPPDVISQVIVAVPLLILYEISILLAARVEKENAAEEAAWD